MPNRPAAVIAVFKAAGPPSIPTGLAAVSITTTTATLIWTAPTGATSFSVQVSMNSSFSSIIINQTGILTASDPITGLSDSTFYYWRVNAANTNGSSGWSSPTTFSTN
jgi:hypothetical protein